VLQVVDDVQHRRVQHFAEQRKHDRTLARHMPCATPRPFTATKRKTQPTGDFRSLRSENISHDA
jgi:hypothetical protein